jgi:hypothetical protein
VNKHEVFNGYIKDTREKGIDFYREAAPFFLGALGAIIENEEQKGSSTIKIDDVLHVMSEAYRFGLGIC